MKTYLVGGAVRDKLLGMTPRDHDYVVVETTQHELEQQGFRRVGASYDVFLHPKTKEEYVLALDLNADLKRRDITINSMALDEKGHLIDPFNGKKDLEEKWLRHTSSHFSDDPLRLYRLARFTAQWPLFNIHPDTVELSKKISKTPEFKKVHANRVFNEFKSALESKCPGRFFFSLDLLGAKDVYFNKIVQWDHIENSRADSLVRFCYLAQWMTKADINELCEKLGTPALWRTYALASSLAMDLIKNEVRNTNDLIEFYYNIDAFRRPELVLFLRDFFGEKFDQIKNGFFLVRKVSVDIEGKSGPEIARALKRKRAEVLEQK